MSSAPITLHGLHLDVVGLQAGSLHHLQQVEAPAEVRPAGEQHQPRDGHCGGDRH